MTTDKTVIPKFTGFYCKKNKVYDGWILKHPKSTEPEEKGWIVVWKDFGWKLKCVNLVNGEELFTEFSDYFANDCNVIGNIYENPELLYTNVQITDEALAFAKPMLGAVLSKSTTINVEILKLEKEVLYKI